MEKVIKTVYASMYQKSKGVTYKEKAVITLATIGSILAIIIPLFYTFLSGN